MPDVPYRVDKPWGHELVWARTDRYVGKILHVKAGHVLSLQYHNLKDETIYLQSGLLLFEIQEGEQRVSREMRPGENRNDEEQMHDDREEYDLEPGQRPIQRRDIRAVVLEIEVHQWVTRLYQGSGAGRDV